MNPIDDLFFGFFEIEFFMLGSDFLKIGIGGIGELFRIFLRVSRCLKINFGTWS
jgi:hypothetical protein